MAMKTLARNYIIYYLADEFNMSAHVVFQALCMLDKCWDMKMDRIKLAIVCASLAFKFHEAEETSGRWIKPGRLLNRFANIATTELKVIKHLNYQMTF
jgi:hypothetical protein